MLANDLRRKGPSMCKIIISLGFAAIFVALGRFLFAPLFSAERAHGATRILFAAGLFTVAIAAVVRK
jgi:Kef-type K+ transport system membrane component KefB